MPETEYECITKEWLQSELRATSASSAAATTTASSLTIGDGGGGGGGSVGGELIILDCRSSHEYSECHIRSAVNFSIPSIMLRRLAAGKIDLLSTIKSPELKERIQCGYKVSLFILYNDVGVLSSAASGIESSGGGGGSTSGGSSLCIDGGVGVGSLNMLAGGGLGGGGGDTTINVLHRRLKQDGCRVVSLQDGFSSFYQAFPEWCEDDKAQNKEMESSRSTQADQLMGLRSLRISTPHSDSACSSSAESSDCESTTHHNFNEAPVEIIPGLFLGNASHSCDSRALQKYNIKYVLNVTPDLPNVFEATGGIQYLQIPITDHYSQDLAMHFPAAIQFIEEARSNNSAVLVHCLAGVSRSVTVTLAYLMHTRALCLNDAFTLVRDRKPDVSPNFHFMQQLHSFERQLRLSPNECSTAMDEGNHHQHHQQHQHQHNLHHNLHHHHPHHHGHTLTAAAVVSIAAAPSTRCGSAAAAAVVSSAAAVAAAAAASASKFSCNCIAADCKCMQTGGFMAAQLAKTATGVGVSPDSGIEFDRWTPAGDSGGLK